MNLHELVANSYQLLTPSADIQSLHQSVLSVKKAYRQLARPDSSRRDMVETKFMLQKWRQDVAEFIYITISTRKQLCTTSHLRALENLELHLRDDFLRFISSAVQQAGSPDDLVTTFNDLLVQQNRCHLFTSLKEDRAAGPRLTLPFRPIQPSRWPHQRWLKKEEFSRYHFHGEETHYRGHAFRPGDLLVTNMNLDSAGVYTLPCTPESFGAHLGIFVLLKRGDRSYPAVLEIFRTGLRALPLSAYLDHEFCAYVEVYRSDQLSKEQREGINEAAEPLIDEIQGYQYYTDIESTTHANCTDIANRLFEISGFGAFKRQTYYTHPMVLENMSRLGFHCREVLSPIDFITDGKMNLIGVVDNGHFYRELPRYVAGQSMIEVFKNSPLELRSLHSFYHLEVWAIGHIQRGNFLGMLIAFFNGFTLQNFPKGPPSLIAFVEYLHSELKKITNRLEPLVLQMVREKSGPLYLYEFQKNIAIQEAMRKSTVALSRYFQPRGGLREQPESQ